MNTQSASTLMEWEPINKRLIKARFTRNTANSLSYNATHLIMTLNMRWKRIGTNNYKQKLVKFQVENMGMKHTYIVFFTSIT